MQAWCVDETSASGHQQHGHAHPRDASSASQSSCYTLGGAARRAQYPSKGAPRSCSLLRGSLFKGASGTVRCERRALGQPSTENSPTCRRLGQVPLALMGANGRRAGPPKSDWPDCSAIERIRRELECTPNERIQRCATAPLGISVKERTVSRHQRTDLAIPTASQRARNHAQKAFHLNYAYPYSKIPV